MKENNGSIDNDGMSNITRKPFFYWLFQVIARVLLKLFFRFKIEGLENVPESGPFLLTSNHHNYLDGVILGAAIKRKISFMVLPNVFTQTWLHPYFHRHVGSIPINLDKPDTGAIKRALKILETGGIVCIFPEGPFSVRGELVDGQPGVALVAMKSGVPIVIAGIKGTYEALTHGSYIPRPCEIRLKFGAPLLLDASILGKTNHDKREEVTDKIMDEISNLLNSMN